MPSDLQERLQTTLGATYRIERELGGGGMSRVFVADDTDLDRKVVVKVLPPDLAAGLNVERFRREIQLAAKLQHPHIVPLLAAGAKDGLLYFTMPFIVGESLRTRLTRQHELPVHDAVRILRDVADALAYAHANGVVHRDIKPDNVLLSGNHAVVTDFGVSKALASSTGQSALTSLGVALGTPAYMSPEQAAAEPNVDHRADIYSLGALGYELLTGRQLFVGMSPQQMLSAHMTQTPEPISKHRSAVSPALEQVIMRCLEKKPADRWQSAEQLLSQLEVLSTPSGGMTPQPMAPAVKPWPRWVKTGVPAVAGLGLLASSALWLGRRPQLFLIGPNTQITSAAGLELFPAISPDGKNVAFASRVNGVPHLYVRQIAGGRAIPLTETMTGGQILPRWSPDGSQLLFSGTGGIWVIPSFGGSPQRVSTRGSFAAWAPDGKRIVYVAADTIFVQSLEGGAPRAVTTAREPHSPGWSPDGRRIAYVAGNSGFYGAIFNTGPSSIWTVPADGGEAVRITSLTRLNTSPVWTADSRQILYVSNAGGSRDIYQQPLHSDGSADGEPIRMTTGISAHSISLSADGSRLAYSVFVYRRNIWTAPISPSGPTPIAAARPLTDENQVVEGISVTADGKFLVFDSNRGGNADIYTMPANGGEATQLTKDPADEFIPQWSRDGREIVFQSWKHGNRDLFVMNADGSNLTQVTSSPLHEMYADWSPKGDQVAYVGQTGSGPQQLFVLSRGADAVWSAPKQLTRDGAGQPARWSPDGKFIAVGGGGGSLKLVSPDGSQRVLAQPATHGLIASGGAVFGPDPNTVYFRATDSTGTVGFYSIPVSGGRVRLLLRFSDPARINPRFEFSTDGKRLFFTIAGDESDVWVMELRKR